MSIYVHGQNIEIDHFDNYTGKLTGQLSATTLTTLTTNIKDNSDIYQQYVIEFD